MPKGEKLQKLLEAVQDLDSGRGATKTEIFKCLKQRHGAGQVFTATLCRAYREGQIDWIGRRFRVAAPKMKKATKKAATKNSKVIKIRKERRTRSHVGDEILETVETETIMEVKRRRSKSRKGGKRKPSRSRPKRMGVKTCTRKGHGRKVTKKVVRKVVRKAARKPAAKKVARKVCARKPREKKKCAPKRNVKKCSPHRRWADPETLSLEVQTQTNQEPMEDQEESVQEQTQ